jgi:hypothetical protein
MVGWPDNIVELRQYTVHAERRHELVALFDAHFVESQEAEGVHVIGQFTDAGRGDRFVWLRGFDGMEQRRAGLTAFYAGPVWAEHKDAANITMIDVDDVLLLRPVAPVSYELPAPPGGASVIVATICGLRGPAEPAVLDDLSARLAASGTETVGVYVTEPRPNTFPVQPVREGEWHVVVLHRQGPALDQAAGSDDDPAGRVRSAVEACLPARLGPPQQVVLDPTPRSRLR